MPALGRNVPAGQPPQFFGGVTQHGFECGVEFEDLPSHIEGHNGIRYALV
jgi:hypothetical protein